MSLETFKKASLPPQFREDTLTEAYIRTLLDVVTSSAGLSWGSIDKSGSNLADLVIRSHGSLQNILGADPASSDTTKNKHVSDNDLKVGADHRASTSAHGSNGDIVGRGDIATTSDAGVIFQAASNADASSSAVSVTSPNAATQSMIYVQADVQSIATLANELKGDVNTLASNLNSLITAFNGLQAALRASGALQT